MSITKKSNWVVAVSGILLVFVTAGCSGGVSFTKEQEEAARHPVADPNRQPQTKEQRDKMAQAMAANREFELHQKPVQFTK